MTIKKPKDWPNVSYKTWRYEKQTKMKHQVLDNYFPQWLQILNKYNKKLNYIDGFGGLGAYHTKNDIENNAYNSKSFGSPILAIKTINRLISENKVTKVNVLIIDKDKNNIANIQKILFEENISPLNYVNFINGDFDVKINEFLDKLDNIAPTFFLIDPFGYSQIKISTIKRIMELEKSEIFLNFMYNAIQRWIKKPALEARFNELFGCEDWKQYADEPTKAKEEKLVALFKKECETFAEYVTPFRLRNPKSDRPYYYLFHLCNDDTGCVKMRASFARFNKGFTDYCGSDQQMCLFDKNSTKKQVCVEKIIKYFSGQNISYKEFRKQMLKLSDYHTERDIIRTLQHLEKRKSITIAPSDGRKRKTGILKTDIIKIPHLS